MDNGKPTVLIVTRDTKDFQELEGYLRDSYPAMRAETIEEAYKALQWGKTKICCVAADAALVSEHSEEAGCLCRTMLRQAPVIVISGDGQSELEERLLKEGAAEVLRKPFTQAVALRRIGNTVQNHAQIGPGHLPPILHQLFDAIMEDNNIHSKKHLIRVIYYTEVLLRCVWDKTGKNQPLDEKTISQMAQAAALHDIGKLLMPDKILQKPGPLTRDEFEIIKTHTVKGCEILEYIKTISQEPYFSYCYDICRYHHERYDGSGYPEGLAGDEIPLLAHIVSIVDVYDTLITKRAYKDAISHEEAVQMIRNGQCGTFAPELVECFIKVCNELHRIALANMD